MKLHALLAAITLASAPAASHGQLCTPQWSDAFSFGLPDDPVRVMAVLDDGGGPALYVGGFFDQFGGVSAGGLAKWDGVRWQTMNGGTNGWVFSLAIYDDGTGPALFVGGMFTSAGGVPAGDLARWDGSSWTSLGDNYAQVRALAVCDTGGGPELYAAGAWNIFGTSSYIARWNGHAWSQVGGGVDGLVRGLAVSGTGNHQSLVVAGDFAHAGGQPAGYIARWDGKKWTTLGSGANDVVLSVAYADFGQGSRLYAGGRFTAIGGVSAPFVGAWDGVAWSSLGAGLWHQNLELASVNAFAVFDGSLYVGGDFDRAGDVLTSDVARWDGKTWSALGGGIVGDQGERWVGALATFQSLTGPRLFVGGQFVHSYYHQWLFPYLATWNGTSWGGPPNRGVNSNQWDSGYGQGEAFATYDDGSGSAVYIGGSFARAGDWPAHNIVRFDGRDWDTSMTPIDEGDVHALEVYDDGSGPALYAAGIFDLAGGTPANAIAGWNGKKWFSLGAGIHWLDGHPAEVFDLQGFNDHGTPLLIAAGNFVQAGDADAFNVAAWDGTDWSALGSGFGVIGPDAVVYAVAVFDDGNGPALYAGGRMTISGQTPLAYVARWTGSAWVDVGGGFDAPVHDLAVFDDGSGPALAAAGEFTRAGGSPAAGIARWDDAKWSAIGQGLPQWGMSLAAFDDGSGEALFASWGGEYVGDPHGLSRWNGNNWTVLSTTPVGSLGVATDRFGPALYCATADAVAGVSSRGIARYGCNQEPACLADCDLSGGLDLFDFLCFTNEFNAGSSAADCASDGVLNLFDFLCFVNLFNTGC